MLNNKNATMSKRQFLTLILNVAGFEMANFELILANGMAGYQFEAHIKGKCEFQIATDSFESAVQDTIKQIYNTNSIDFPIVI